MKRTQKNRDEARSKWLVSCIRRGLLKMSDILRYFPVAKEFTKTKWLNTPSFLSKFSLWKGNNCLKLPKQKTVVTNI